MKFLKNLFRLSKDSNQNTSGLNKSRNQNIKKEFDLDIKKFKTVDNFWEFVTKKNNWYLKYSPYRIKNIENYISELEPLIIKTTNELRKKMEFTYDDYWKIIDWDNFLIRADMDESNDFSRNKALKLEQFCSNCAVKTGFQQRYPKSICGKCYSKTADLNGRIVEFFNTEMGGYGCQGYYVGTKQREKYESELCYIDGKEYYAEEARFGGIVIQLKE